MKTIEEERVIKQTMYVACDGVRFSDQEECATYEKTAGCVLKARYNALLVKNTDEWSVFKGCSEDAVIQIVRVESERDIDTICQYGVYCNDRLDVDKMRSSLLDIVKADNRVFIGRGYDCDTFYLIGSRSTILARIDSELSESENK